MKKRFILFCSAMMIMATLVGCGSQNDSLLTVKPFPKLSDSDMEGNVITNDIFSNYDATIVNFWSNGCGTCIEEMPELEELYHTYQEQNINLIGVASDSGEDSDMLAQAKNILENKGVTYMNISPNTEGTLYEEIFTNMQGFPTTYVVDHEGNLIGAPIIGNVKEQMDALEDRLAQAKTNAN